MFVRFALILSAIFLGACSMKNPSFMNTSPIEVSYEPVSHRFDGPRLSTRALNSVADDIMRRGHGAVTVTAFYLGHDNKAEKRIAQAQAERVKVYLFQQNVKNPINAVSSTVSDGEKISYITISYDTIAASAAAGCVDISDADADHYTHSSDAPYQFGCARQKQLAAMVARPSDLLGNAETVDADSARLSKTLDNYRAGERATSPADEGLSASTVYQE